MNDDITNIVNNLEKTCVNGGTDVSFYRKMKIKYWETVLRTGDWLGYKDWDKRIKRSGIPYKTDELWSWM